MVNISGISPTKLKENRVFYSIASTRHGKELVRKIVPFWRIIIHIREQIAYKIDEL